MSVFIGWAGGEEIREDILCMGKLEGKTTGKLALELLKIAIEKFGLNFKEYGWGYDGWRSGYGR